MFNSTIKHFLFARTLFLRKVLRVWWRENKVLTNTFKLNDYRTKMKNHEMKVTWIYPGWLPRENKVTLTSVLQYAKFWFNMIIVDGDEGNQR